MKVGDLVRMNYDRKTIFRVDKIEEETVDMTTDGKDMVRVHPQDIYHVTVADAFALAGHPVPEGAKLVRQCGDVNGLFWTCHLADSNYFFGEIAKGGPFDGWRIMADAAITRGAWSDLSRLPVSDAIDALPEVVRKAMDKTMEVNL